MRRFWLVGCLALAACDDAVILEVHTAPNVPAEEVTLFLGLGSCGECPGIQPPNTPEILPGWVYFRDDSNHQSRTLTAKVEGGVATFRIESGVASSFDFAVAVDSGQRSAAQIRGLAVNESARYRVELREANVGGGLGIKPNATSTSYVGIWSPSNGGGTCIGFEDWANGKLVDRSFIVPADDLDCDARGPMNMECAPYGFDAIGRPTFDQASCTIMTAATADTDSCWLGGPACDELTGSKTDCFPTDYCMPTSFCEGANLGCTPATGPINLNVCLFNSAPSGKLKCEIGFEPQSDNLHAHVCESGFEFDLLPQRTANSPLSCVDVPENKLMLPRPATTGAPREFTDKVVLDTKDGSGMVYPFEFAIHYQSNDCTYKVQLDGEKALNAAFPQEKQFFAQFWTMQSGARLRKMLVPVELVMVNECTRGSTCTFVPDESLTNCLR